MTDTTNVLPESDLEHLAEDLTKYLAQAATNTEHGSTPTVEVECAKRMVRAVYLSFAHGRVTDIPGEAIEKSQELGRVLRSNGYQLRDVFQSIVLLRKSARELLQGRASLLGLDPDQLQVITSRWFDGLVFAGVYAYYEGQRTELQRPIVVDGLTGVFNRGYFGERLSEEIERARRYSHSVTLLMVDVDSLKPINDRFGHRAGDFVLKHVSQVLQSQSRLVDVVARYGGDEFGVIMPETTPDGGWILAERITKTIRETRGEKMGDLQSVSIGIASFPRDADTPDELVEAADKALYRCKSQGGNTVAAFGGAIAEEDTPQRKIGRRASDKPFEENGDSTPVIVSDGDPGARASRLETHNLELRVSVELIKRKLVLYEKLEQSFQTIIEDCLRMASPESDEDNVLGPDEHSASLQPERLSHSEQSIDRSARSFIEHPLIVEDYGTGQESSSNTAAEQTSAQIEDLVRPVNTGKSAADLQNIEQQREQARDQVEAVLNVINDLLASLNDIEQKS